MRLRSSKIFSLIAETFLAQQHRIFQQ